MQLVEVFGACIIANERKEKNRDIEREREREREKQTTRISTERQTPYESPGPLSDERVGESCA
jgi:hypothetical protein